MLGIFLAHSDIQDLCSILSVIKKSKGIWLNTEEYEVFCSLLRTSWRMIEHFLHKSEEEAINAAATEALFAQWSFGKIIIICNRRLSKIIYGTWHSSHFVPRRCNNTTSAELMRLRITKLELWKRLCSKKNWFKAFPITESHNYSAVFNRGWITPPTKHLYT